MHPWAHVDDMLPPTHPSDAMRANLNLLLLVVTAPPTQVIPKVGDSAEQNEDYIGGLEDFVARVDPKTVRPSLLLIRGACALAVSDSHARAGTRILHERIRQ
jgi:hypothetical protein